MKTKVDDALARAEVEHAHDPERAEAIARVRRFKAGWYELAETLSELRRNEQYKRWGYPDFDDYCKRELHLRKETVDKLTGSFTFLRKKAPDALRRDGRDAPIPSYQAVDFWRRAEEEAGAPEETVREIRRAVIELRDITLGYERMYRQVVFPVDEEDRAGKRRATLKTTIDKLIELLAVAREEGSVPAPLCAEVEEPLARLAQHLAD